MPNIRSSRRPLWFCFTSALMCGASIAAAPDDFATSFTGKTLRFDYFHSGIATEEHISLDEFRLEGDWPGSRVRLVDDSGLGNYSVEVVDPANDRVLYSRGFDSIFGEWQTTAEAAQAWRTFHESQRIPEPARDMRVLLKRRGADGKWSEIYSGTLRLKGPDVNRAPLRAAGTVWSVFQNGEPSAKVDLLILGDGYSAEETKKFHDDATRLSGVLFDTEPFRSRRGDFNVWALDLPAPASGISDPRRNIWRNSPLGFRSNAFGIDRYALSMDNRSIREAAALAPYDALIAITNTRKHAGGGIYNLWANAPADSPTAPYVFVHELGHSFAGLEDEYYSAEVAYIVPDHPTEPWRPNVTALLDPKQLKWRDLVDPATPIPTPWNQVEYDRVSSTFQGQVRKLEGQGAESEEIQKEYSKLRRNAGEILASEKFVGKTGAFQGAGYQAKGLYRPEVDCIMFSHNRGAFCRVCSRAIERAIDREGNREQGTGDSRRKGIGDRGQGTAEGCTDDR
jgi:hypothetical protein